MPAANYKYNNSSSSTAKSTDDDHDNVDASGASTCDGGPVNNGGTERAERRRTSSQILLGCGDFRRQFIGERLKEEEMAHTSTAIFRAEYYRDQSLTASAMILHPVFTLPDIKDYGHRVRLATHSIFKEFVLTAGLEFYPLDGDPKVLISYLVRNKGFLPSGPSEILVNRNQLKQIIWSLLPACKEPDIDSGIPFEAEAIIANPPAYGEFLSLRKLY
ncbi:Sterol 3-beta-glucosyltransferase UGT80A2 [Linum grandiflorum]